MIDDSSSERTAINKAWPSTVVLLCTFHFLQRRWTWLQDGQNRVDKNDRLSMQTARALLNLITINYFKHVHKLLDTLISYNIYSLSGKKTYMGTLLSNHSASMRKSYE